MRCHFTLVKKIGSLQGVWFCGKVGQVKVQGGF